MSARPGWPSRPSRRRRGNGRSHWCQGRHHGSRPIHGTRTNPSIRRRGRRPRLIQRRGRRPSPDPYPRRCAADRAWPVPGSARPRRQASRPQPRRPRMNAPPGQLRGPPGRRRDAGRPSERAGAWAWAGHCRPRTRQKRRPKRARPPRQHRRARRGQKARQNLPAVTPPPEPRTCRPRLGQGHPPPAQPDGPGWPGMSGRTDAGSASDRRVPLPGRRHRWRTRTRPYLRPLIRPGAGRREPRLPPRHRRRLSRSERSPESRRAGSRRPCPLAAPATTHFWRAQRHRRRARHVYR